MVVGLVGCGRWGRHILRDLNLLSCEVPVVASNAALRQFLAGLPLELSFPPRDAEALADRLVALAAAEPSVRADTGAELRRRVVAGHSVGSWAEAVTATVARLTRE